MLSYLFLLLCVSSRLEAAPNGAAVAEEGEKVSFVGYRVLAATPNTEDNVALLQEMESADTLGVEFWSHPSDPQGNCTLSVHPDMVPLVEEFFDDKDISHSVIADNLQELIDQEMKEVLKEDEDDGLNYRDPSRSYYDMANYNRLSQITMHVKELIQQYAGVGSVSSIGRTSEGRDIQMVKLALSDGRKRPAVWVDCGIHAREWISPSFCVYFIKNLLDEGQRINSGQSQKSVLNGFDVFVVPIANPDGYEYSWNSNRMWRKNRRSITRSGSNNEDDVTEVEEAQTKQFWNFPSYPQQQQPGSGFGFPGQGFGGGFGGQPQRPSHPNKCAGVDPNRNFDISFGVVGSSNSPCKDTYHGPYAFSEKESQAVRDGVRRIKATHDLVSFVSVHAYSQLWMFPSGHSKRRVGDYTDLKRLSQVAVSSLTATYGTQYRTGPINEVIYQASGSSVDWAYDVENIKYSYALELRDTGAKGFLLPVSQIEPTNKETYNGLKAMFLEMAKEY